MTKQIESTDWYISFSLGVLALGLYHSTLAPTVLEADSGEFQFVSWLPGIAHPTGYPFYTLLGWIWTHLFVVGDVAWRMNLLSALFGAGTVSLTYLIAKQIGQTTIPHSPILTYRLTAILASLMFMVNATFWSQAIIAEVYTLHALFLALIIGLTLYQRQFTATIAFIYGLSLTHHITTILIAPALGLFFWFNRSQTVDKTEQNRLFSLTLGRNLLIVLAPLLLYLYLPWIAPNTPYTTISLSKEQTLVLYENSLSGFLQHITGTVFTDELQPMAVGLDRIIMVGEWFVAQLTWGGVFLSLIGLTILLAHNRYDIVGLTGLIMLAYLGFNLIYFIGDVYVLFIPVWLITCLWIGLGCLGLSHWLANRFIKSRLTQSTHRHTRRLEQVIQTKLYGFLVAGFISVWLVLPLWLLFQQLPHLNQANNTTAAERWQTILTEPLPENAVLISNDRNEIMPMWYYQYVEGQRPDLQGLFPLITPDPAYSNVGRVLDEALSSNRPVYLIKPMPGLTVKANLKSIGTLFLARAYTQTATYPTNVTFGDTITLIGYDTAQQNEQLMVTLYWQPIQTMAVDYTSFVHLIDSAGDGVTQHDAQPGGRFYSTRYWQPGEQLVDVHRLNLPSDIAPTSYELRVGWYHQPQPGQFENLGQAHIIGSITLINK